VASNQRVVYQKFVAHAPTIPRAFHRPDYFGETDFSPTDKAKADSEPQRIDAPLFCRRRSILCKNF
jgi:hypothetical protein